MNLYSLATADVIGLSILLILFLHGKNLYPKGQAEPRLFSALLLMSALSLASDFLSWLPEYFPSRASRFLLEAFNLIYYLTMMSAGSLWLIYCDVRLISGGRLQRRQLSYLIPFVSGLLLTLINIKTHWIYFFDGQNRYRRGPAYMAIVLLLSLALAYSVVIVLVWGRKRNHVQRQDAYSLLTFMIPLVIALAVQTLFYGVNLTPLGLAFSLMLVFMHRQSALITEDHLTRLNNSRAFERFLEQRLSNPAPDQKIFLLMMDADHFKAINDTFGHNTGNEALARIAAVLKSVCRRSDLIARLGGDEFGVVGVREDEREVSQLCQRIRDAIGAENRAGQNPYGLSLSIGYAICDETSRLNADAMMRAADEAMYNNKRHSR